MRLHSSLQPNSLWCYWAVGFLQREGLAGPGRRQMEESPWGRRGEGGGRTMTTMPLISFKIISGHQLLDMWEMSYFIFLSELKILSLCQIVQECSYFKIKYTKMILKQVHCYQLEVAAMSAYGRKFCKCAEPKRSRFSSLLEVKGEFQLYWFP